MRYYYSVVPLDANGVEMAPGPPLQVDVTRVITEELARRTRIGAPKARSSPTARWFGWRFIRSARTTSAATCSRG